MNQLDRVKNTRCVFLSEVETELLIIIYTSFVRRHAVAWMVEALCYKSEGRGFDSIPDEVIGFFNLPNHTSCTMALGSTQPLTEMSTRNLPGGTGRPAREADNLTVICEPIV
jgi:hypothetical protein